MIRHSSLAFSVAFGAVLFWAPLPFGSVGSGFRVLLWGLLVLIFLAGVWSRDLRASWLSARGAIFCALAIAGLALLQSLSWPAGVVRVVSPGHYRLAQTAQYSTQQAVQETTGIENGDLRAGLGRVPLSFSQRSSRRAAMAWTMMAIGLFCGSLLSSRRERRVLFAALVCAAVFQTVYGGPRLFGGADLIWAQVMPSAEGRFRGTFVNPNHAAFFMGLVLPLVTAWLWLTSLRWKDGDYARLGVLFVGLPVLVWVLLAGGIFLTQSRAGAVAMLVALCLQVVLLSGRRLKVGLLLGGLGSAVVLGWLMRSTGGGLGQRLWEARVSGSAGGIRGSVYQAVLSLWREFPLVGSGLGSFRSLFSARGPAEIRGQWWNAHSDWLELLITGGALSVILLLIALTLVVRRSSGALSSVSRERQVTGVAVVGALVAAALHSLVDFGLAMPANALSLAAIAGVGLAPSGLDRLARKPGSDSVTAEVAGMDAESSTDNQSWPGGEKAHLDNAGRPWGARDET